MPQLRCGGRRRGLSSSGSLSTQLSPSLPISQSSPELNSPPLFFFPQNPIPLSLLSPPFIVDAGQLLCLVVVVINGSCAGLAALRLWWPRLGSGAKSPPPPGGRSKQGRIEGKWERDRRAEEEGRVGWVGPSPTRKEERKKKRAGPAGREKKGEGQVDPTPTRPIPKFFCNFVI